MSNEIDFVPLSGQEIIFDFQNQTIFLRRQDPSLSWYRYQKNEWVIRRKKGQILIIPHVTLRDNVTISGLFSWHFFRLLTHPSKEPFQVLYLPSILSKKVIYFEKGKNDNIPVETLYQYWGEGVQDVGKEIFTSTTEALRRFLREPIPEYLSKVENLRSIYRPQN